MSPKTWFYRDGRPNRVARVIDRCTAALAARGVGPDYLVTLDVPGRRSGRTIAVPLVVADADGERYVVSMLGEDTNWVRNVRAADGDVTLRHSQREHVHLEELPPERRASVLKAYLQRARNARAHVPVDPDAPLEEFTHVSAHIPVFRVVARSSA